MPLAFCHIACGTAWQNMMWAWARPGALLASCGSASVSCRAVGVQHAQDWQHAPMHCLLLGTVLHAPSCNTAILNKTVRIVFLLGASQQAVFRISALSSVLAVNQSLPDRKPMPRPGILGHSDRENSRSQSVCFVTNAHGLWCS